MNENDNNNCLPSKRIGIYGGTFDPIHKGHINLAKDALKCLNLDEIVFLPTKCQPFKIGRKVASETHRINMIKLAIENYSKFKISLLEINSDKISYTFDTLKYIKNHININDEIFFIMGTDAFFSIEKWYNSKKLLKQNNFAVGIRPGDDKTKVLEYQKILIDKYNTKIQIIENKEIDVSSTDIKDYIKKNDDIDSMVENKVKRYIYEQGVYR